MSSPLGAGAEARPTHTFSVATHVLKVERVLRELGGGAFTGGQMPAAPTGAGYDAAGRRDAAADVDAVLVSAAAAAAQVTRNGGARDAQEAANVCGQAAVHAAVLDSHAMFFLMEEVPGTDSKECLVFGSLFYIMLCLGRPSKVATMKRRINVFEYSTWFFSPVRKGIGGLEFCQTCPA